MTQRSYRFLLPIILISATFLAYFPALRGNFLWDDDRHVSENHTLRSLKGLERIWFEPRYTPQYYPLTHTTFWLEYRLWGLSPLGYHIDNVLLHALNALLLWQLLRRLNVSGAALAAVIFALHPIEVESVAWISERKNVLSTFCALLSIHAFLRTADRDGEVHGGWYAGSLLAFIAAMFSKTVACSVPAVLLVVLWWKTGRVRLLHLCLLAPFFAIGIPLSRMTAHTEVANVGAHGPDWNLSGIQRVLIAGRAIWFYAAKLVLPLNLTFSYPRWRVDASEHWQFFFPLAVIVAAIAICLFRRRGLVAAVAIFVGVLVPALGFVNTYPMRYSFVADHFQYAAGIALIVLFSTFVVRMVREPIAVILLGTILGCLTWQQAHAYVGPEALWNDVIAKNPTSWLARQNLGVLLSLRAQTEPEPQANHDLEQAVALFEKVNELRPQHEKLQVNWAEALFHLGRWDDCLPHYEAALRGDVIRWVVLDRMGVALLKLNRPTEAESRFRASLDAGGKADPELHLAEVLTAEHQYARAATHLEQYVLLVPSEAKAHEDLGRLYLNLNRPDEAVKQFSEALSLSPDSESARQGLLDAVARRVTSTDRPSPSK